MKTVWDQRAEDARRDAWHKVGQALWENCHDLEKLYALDRKYLRDALCGTVLSESEYKTLDLKATSDWQSVENLATILRKVYLQGVADGVEGVCRCK